MDKCATMLFLMAAISMERADGGLLSLFGVRREPTYSEAYMPWMQSMQYHVHPYVHMYSQPIVQQHYVPVYQHQQQPMYPNYQQIQIFPQASSVPQWHSFPLPYHYAQPWHSYYPPDPYYQSQTSGIPQYPWYQRPFFNPWSTFHNQFWNSYGSHQHYRSRPWWWYRYHGSHHNYPDYYHFGVHPSRYGHHHRSHYGHYDRRGIYQTGYCHARPLHYLDTSSWWQCSSGNPMHCLSQLLEQAHRVIDSGHCHGRTCTGTARIRDDVPMLLERYQNMLSSIPHTTGLGPCHRPSFTRRMTLYANIVLSRLKQSCYYDTSLIQMLNRMVANQQSLLSHCWYGHRRSGLHWSHRHPYYSQHTRHPYGLYGSNYAHFPYHPSLAHPVNWPHRHSYPFPPWSLEKRISSDQHRLYYGAGSGTLMQNLAATSGTVSPAPPYSHLGAYGGYRTDARIANEAKGTAYGWSPSTPWNSWLPFHPGNARAAMAAAMTSGRPLAPVAAARLAAMNMNLDSPAKTSYGVPGKSSIPGGVPGGASNVREATVPGSTQAASPLRPKAIDKDCKLCPKKLNLLAHRLSVLKKAACQLRHQMKQIVYMRDTSQAQLDSSLNQTTSLGDTQQQYNAALLQMGSQVDFTQWRINRLIHFLQAHNCNT